MRRNVFIILFSLLLVIPTVLSFFSKSSDVNIENRSTMTKPVFSTDTMQNATLMQKSKSYASELKTYCYFYNLYYDDNFVLRDPLMKRYLSLKILLGSGSVGKTVMRGKDGWYFLGEHYSNIVSESLGAKPFTDMDKKQIVERLLDCKHFCDSMNVTMMLVIPPNKMSIYYEYFPIQVTCRESRYDQVNELMKGLDVPYVDLKDLMLKNKKDSVYLYRHIDTHWNNKGAFIAYQAIMEKFRLTCPDMTSLTDSMVVEGEVMFQGDLTNMLAMHDEKEKLIVLYPPVMGETIEPPTLNSINGFDYYRSRCVLSTGKRKLVIFGDSFCAVMFPFFSASCHEILFYQCVGDVLFDKNVVEQEKPDFVLVEVCEREIETLLNLGINHYE